ncbi:MAG: SoxR reducing system RseC family protein, partial [Candidatus Omnitrophica bacterium]|nr:SoxR reducing system RseC family protein [Candidatus Omnitrophota bacterium]
SVLDADKQKVTIVFKKKKMCDCCRLSSFCGKGEESMIISNPGLDLNPGDQIEIAVNENKNIQANILAFLLPALVFLATLVFSPSNSELFSFFLAIFLVCLYYILLKIFMKRFNKYFEIKIVKKVT